MLVKQDENLQIAPEILEYQDNQVPLVFRNIHVYRLTLQETVHDL